MNFVLKKDSGRLDVLIALGTFLKLGIRAPKMNANFPGTGELILKPPPLRFDPANFFSHGYIILNFSQNLLVHGYIIFNPFFSVSPCKTAKNPKFFRLRRANFFLMVTLF